MREAISLEASDLTAIEPSALARINILSRVRAPFPLATQVGTVSLAQVAPAQAPAWEGSYAQIDAACGDRRACVWLPYDVIDAVVRGAHPELDTEALGPEEAALVVEALESGLVEALAGAARADLSLLGITKVEAPDEQPTLAFAISGEGGVALPLFLRCHDVERSRIFEAIAARPAARAPFPGLTATVAFRCGHSALSLMDLATLEVGSGIVLDDTTLSFQKIVAVVAERFVQSCTWQTIKPVLDGPLLMRAGPTTLPYTTGHSLSEPANPPGGAPPTASVGEVPVNLVFELGRTEVPVAELETLQTGYVFDLGKPLSQGVEILANGRRIGSGELVRLGESIGVRVTRLVR